MPVICLELRTLVSILSLLYLGRKKSALLNAAAAASQLLKLAKTYCPEVSIRQKLGKKEKTRGCLYAL